MAHQRSKKWGVLPSILVLSPILISIPLLTISSHYALPEPLIELFNPVTKLPQLSERAILEHAKYLSEDIGFRTVGTREHALGDAWMVDKAEELKAQCDAAVSSEPGRKLECEVWRQVGSGSHRFDILHARLYKTYVNLTNIIIRVSDGTDRGKEHAVLVNAHLDSTIPSPGAADDALPVGVMIEIVRNLIATKGWEPQYSIIFLFNNAEESLQDGSHLFSTKHPIAPTVRAVINLEAAGTHGPTLLFQATSEQMIEAYSHVPRPYGTSLANDIFSSGIIMSDTDFRQFELYLNVTGLDTAIVGNSYFYHTRKDLVQYIQPGVAQYMADNTLVLLQYLSSSNSPIPTLTTGYTRPTTVYYSLLGRAFVQYSFRTANTMHLLLFVSSILFVTFSSKPPSSNRKAKANKLDQNANIWIEQAKGVGSILTAILGSMVGVNIVAFIMSKVLNRSLSWFQSEYSCVLLYGPAALAGALAPQLFFSRTRERTLLTSVLLCSTFAACAVQLCGIGSAALFFMSSASLFVALVADLLVTGAQKDVWLGTYAIGQTVTLVLGTEAFIATADSFVPLTGRMGADAPAEHIIACLVALTTSYTAHLTIPFCHRFGKKFILRAFVSSVAVTGLMMAIFSFRSPFDAMHPKRFYMMHLENITTNEVGLHMAAADAAPHFEHLVQEMADFIGGQSTQAVPVEMTPYNGDWDVIYPFSAFLSPFKIDMAPSATPWASENSFTVTAVNDVIDEPTGTRSLTIVVHHPGLIWTVIAFDAYVLKWSLDDNPPREHARHHIKEASFYGVDTWTVDLVILLPDHDPALGNLQVNFVGIQEKVMWPGKKAEKESGGPAMQLFEKLDGWLQDHTDDAVDATFLGCVGGVTII